MLEPVSFHLYYFRSWKTVLTLTVAKLGRSFYFQGSHENILPKLAKKLFDLNDTNKNFMEELLMNPQKASVVIPVYNQWNSLKRVLLAFSQQSIPKSDFEIIIIDDGSSDDVLLESSESLSQKYLINIVLYHQSNCGRASARNAGIRLALNNNIIFCDADRVPCNEFVKYHLDSHIEENCVVIGNQFDLFYKNIDSLFTDYIHWDIIKRFSKKPNYFSRICMIYESCKCVATNLRWMSFLVGNSSVSKKKLIETGVFDENFSEWGFEHFELGLRLQYNGAKFFVNELAANYHIPHSRNNYFYTEMINKSAELLLIKHPEVDIDIMKKILMNNINAINYNECIFKRGII